MQRIPTEPNVVLAIRELDLLMRCHGAGTIDGVWCDEPLAEYERSLRSHALAAIRPLTCVPHAGPSPDKTEPIVSVMRSIRTNRRLVPPIGVRPW